MNKLENIKQALRFINVSCYESKSSYAESNAEMNLQGKTHYVDADTLKYFKSRILRSHASNNGLYFILQESLPHPDYNYKRVRRNVVFDVFGKVLEGRDVIHTSAVKADKAYYELCDLMQSENQVLTAYTTVSNHLNKILTNTQDALKALSE